MDILDWPCENQAIRYGTMNIVSLLKITFLDMVIQMG